MIKSFTPRPYDGDKLLPSYVTNVRMYTLVATVTGGYNVVLGKLSIGDSVSAGNPLAHAVFESFDDHGRHMTMTRSRMNGREREYAAVKNSMFDAGVEFAPDVTFCESEKFLDALGAWFQGQNPDIKITASCHKHVIDYAQFG